MEAAVAEGVKAHLSECSKVLVFDEGNNVLFSNFPVNKMELPGLSSLLKDRDAAIKRGAVVAGKRYEVHRHHPPLVYGRNMVEVEPEVSTGWAICQTDLAITGRPCYALITYEMPNISARMVPKLREFSERVLKAKQ
ncbi:hypothetical protein N2152v2_006499 [Parachlorella kessleri]